jgi:hypothetical protein
MSNYWPSIVIGVVILAAAIPYVARIRHPAQKPFAAYLIFLTVFLASGLVLFAVLTWLAGSLGLVDALNRLVPALVFLTLVFVPAIALATWQARKPPTSPRQPD